jgi:hypothetical protein
VALDRAEFEAVLKQSALVFEPLFGGCLALGP